MVKRRVLVTGGAGFLGSALVRELCAAGTSVVVLDDLSTGRAVDLAPEAELLVGDVADPAIVRKAAGGCEVLFHLAAARAVPRSIEEPLETDTANVHGTLAALVAAREAGVRRVVLASSSSVYGQPAVVPTPESAPLAPASPYGVSKLAGEHYGRVFGELHGLEVVALRYFNLYGPGQRADLVHATLVPRLLAALRGGGRPEVHGDGCQRRDFTYVSDA
ncbi:MAG: NAD-dependent epimerase/dehydratase family protein, partial [Acidimicrobiia bacterium]|nr:NAD-dependent epimerase/dehydratase family protein [Acidimicrobiia bacterium]